MSTMEHMGFASSNIVFGVGSFTYQMMTRDTLGFAVKATWGLICANGTAIFKDPITDEGTKKSAKGLMVVNRDSSSGKLVLSDNLSAGEYSHMFSDGEMRPVYGPDAGEQDKKTHLRVDDTIEEIRERLQ